MKKILSIAAILTIVTTFSFNGNYIKTNEVNLPLDETTQDIFENDSGIRLEKKSYIGQDEILDVSQIFVQTGRYDKDGKTYNALRFAVAVKGDISSIVYSRGYVDGITNTQDKDVSYVYRGITSNNETLYYNPDAPDANELGLTNNVEYANVYYWACYTIGFNNSSFEYANIPVSLKVNDIDYGSRKASFAEVNYGMHEHEYTNISHNEHKHFKTCSLCNTIDDLSYENHNYNIKFNKNYNVGDTFSTEDITLEYNCDCGQETFDPSLLTITKYPEDTLKLCDTLTINNNGLEEEVSLPVYDYFSPDWTANWDYTQGASTSKVSCAQKGEPNYFKIFRGSKDSWGGIKNKNFVAPTSDFDFIFRLKVLQGKLNLKVRSKDYCVNVAFDLDSNGNNFIAENYDPNGSYTRSEPFDATIWHTYKVSVRKTNEGKFVSNVYIDNNSEPLLENIYATAGGTDLLLIAIGKKAEAGNKNLTESYIEYLTFNIK